MEIGTKFDLSVSELPLRSPVGELLAPPLVGGFSPLQAPDIKLCACHAQSWLLVRPGRSPLPHRNENCCAAAIASGMDAPTTGPADNCRRHVPASPNAPAATAVSHR